LVHRLPPARLAATERAAHPGDGRIERYLFVIGRHVECWNRRDRVFTRVPSLRRGRSLHLLNIRSGTQSSTVKSVSAHKLSSVFSDTGQPTPLRTCRKQRLGIAWRWGSRAGDRRSRRGWSPRRTWPIVQDGITFMWSQWMVAKALGGI